MSKEELTKILTTPKYTLKYNHQQKSVKLTFVSYPDTESWCEKIGTCESDFRINLTFKKKIQKLQYAKISSRAL